LSYNFIYFDLDDTLLDHKAAEASGLRDVHQYFPMFDDSDPQTLIDTYHDVNSEQWRLYSQGDVTREQLQQNRFEQTLQRMDLDASLFKEVGDYYMQCYRDHWQWINGAEKVYQQVVQYYPVGMLTNGFAETQRLKFKKFNFYDSADHVVISEDVGVLKPDPKVFAHATELAGVAPDDILYVGDSLTSDIEGGSRFGWNTAWFTSNGDHPKDHKADLVFNDFEELIKFLEI